MALILYASRRSPPVRAVLITAKAIGLSLVEKEVNFFVNENMRSELGKINPQKTIPTLVDGDGFTIWDSHAIMIYLISKYAKDDSLYPIDSQKRAIINQRLFFESGSLFFHVKNIAKSIIFEGQNFIDSEEEKQVLEGYRFLEKFLKGKKWVCGDFISIADYSLFATVTSINSVISIDPKRFPDVSAWLERCDSLPECAEDRKRRNEGTNSLKIRLTKKII